MAIKVSFPLVNPFKFVKFSTPNTDAYFHDSIPHFEQQATYCHPWKQGDTLRFQLGISAYFYNLSQMEIGLYECGTDTLVDAFSAEFAWLDSLVNVIVSLQVPVVTGGHYIMIKNVYNTGFNHADDFWVSEAFEIKATQPDTMLLQYYDKGYNKGVRWFDYDDLPVPFYFRCYGGARSDGFNAESDDTFFTSQTHGGRQLNGTPYISQKFTFGNYKGVPNFVLDQLNRILGCRYLFISETGNPLIDEKQWSKHEGSKLEHEYLDNYPMSLPTCALILAENKDVNEYDEPGMSVDYGDVVFEEFVIDSGDFVDGLVSLVPTIPIAAPFVAYFVDGNGLAYEFSIIDVNADGSLIQINAGDLYPDDYDLLILTA